MATLKEDTQTVEVYEGDVGAVAWITAFIGCVAGIALFCGLVGLAGYWIYGLL